MPVDLPRSSAPIRESVLQTGDGIARFSTVSLERARSTGVMNHTESGFRCPRDRGRSMNLGWCIISNALADVDALPRIKAKRPRPLRRILPKDVFRISRSILRRTTFGARRD